MVKKRLGPKLLAATALFGIACAGVAAADDNRMTAAMLPSGSSAEQTEAPAQMIVSVDAILQNQNDNALVLAHSWGHEDGWVRLRGLNSVELDDVPSQTDTFNGDGDDNFRVQIDDVAFIRIRPENYMYWTDENGQTKTLGKAVHESDSSATIGYDIFLEWPRGSGNFKVIGGDVEASTIGFWYMDDGTVNTVLHIKTDTDWTEDGIPPKPGKYEATINVYIWGPWW